MATFLMRNLSVPSDSIWQEQMALDTIGNAYFTRLLHTDVVPGMRRLAVITNRWHMARVRAVFDHIFALPASEGDVAPGYVLTYYEESDALPADVLDARVRDEQAKAPRYAEGSEWRARLRDVRALHAWMNLDHGAYAARRLLDPEWHRPEEGAALASYRV